MSTPKPRLFTPADQAGAAIRRPSYKIRNIPTPNVVSSGGGPNATGMVLAAGAIAFVGTWRDPKLSSTQVSAASIRIVVSTTLLAVLASVTENTALGEPFKWLAIVMVLVALLRYVPKFSTKAKAK